MQPGRLGRGNQSKLNTDEIYIEGWIDPKKTQKWVKIFQVDKISRRQFAKIEPNVEKEKIEKQTFLYSEIHIVCK